MRLQTVSLAVMAILCVTVSGLQSKTKNHPVTLSKITFVKHEADRRVDVLVDGKLFTSYCWPTTVYKPILYPILTAAGTPITRGFPLNPRPDERQDHRHQVGNWLNYGKVNGYDFWGNGVDGKRNVHDGQIKHLDIVKLTEGIGSGSMVTTASWVDPSDKELLAEKTVFHFFARDSIRIIDRIVTLTATGKPVLFKDTKEGFLGIRVAHQLELPSKDDITLSDVKGNLTTVKALQNNRASGNYRSSEGVTGEAVWGTRAKWMNLYGYIGKEKISLVICDHPKNLSYPTYWHARGYGLFAANPFGVKDFTGKKDSLNFSISAGQSITCRYRIIISSGSHLTDQEINTFANVFSKQYE